jgi:hypothetical protein
MHETSKRLSPMGPRGGDLAQPELAANACLPPARGAAAAGAGPARLHLPAPSLRVHTFAR